MVFVNNTGNKTLTSVALKGDTGNAVLGTIPSAEFEDVALGDMQFSEGEWLFVNLGAANKVATIDPLTGATQTHVDNLATGTRPVHIYRDLDRWRSDLVDERRGQYRCEPATIPYVSTVRHLRDREFGHDSSTTPTRDREGIIPLLRERCVFWPMGTGNRVFLRCRSSQTGIRFK